MAFLMDSPFEASFPVSTTAVVEGSSIMFAVVSGVLTVTPTTGTTSLGVGAACQDGAVGDVVRVRLLNAAIKGKVAGAYTAGSAVYHGASGLFTATANTGSVQKYLLLETATSATGQIVSMLPIVASSAGS